MVAGGGGALLAGWVNDRIARRSGPAGKLRLLMAICLVALPSTLLVLAPTFGVGLAMVILSIAVMPMVGTTLVSTITELVPGTKRGVDRKSGGSGKRVSVRVDNGGGRITKKKKKIE